VSSYPVKKLIGECQVGKELFHPVKVLQIVNKVLFVILPVDKNSKIVDEAISTPKKFSLLANSCPRTKFDFQANSFPLLIEKTKNDYENLD
jgi:hypothetical protein